MIIYFSASNRDAADQNVSTYQHIVRTVREAGHQVNDWAESVSPDGEWSATNVVADSHRSIERAELLIIEASGPSVLRTGYELALAVQHKKPVLILVKEDELATSFAAGLQAESVEQHSYNEYTLDKIIRDFLKENEIKTKDLRFNFVIDRKIYNHLRLKSFKTGKTKAEVVRDLLMEDIEKDK